MHVQFIRLNGNIYYERGYIQLLCLYVIKLCIGIMRRKVWLRVKA